MGKTFGVAEFKAHCLQIIDGVDRNGESVTITKRGRPVAELRPVAKQERRSIIGALKETVLRYDHPFNPAADADEWLANR
jgi:prevent-host-death family protein